MLVDAVRLGQGVDDLLRQHDGAAGLVELGLDHRELVTTQARHRIGLAHDVDEVRGDRLEQRVAGRMPQGVVDLLEAVEVQEMQRDKLAVPLG